MNLITKVATICFSSRTAITINTPSQQPQLTSPTIPLPLTSPPQRRLSTPLHQKQPQSTSPQEAPHQFHYHNHHHQTRLHIHQHHFHFHGLHRSTASTTSRVTTIHFTFKATTINLTCRAIITVDLTSFKIFIIIKNNKIL